MDRPADKALISVKRSLVSHPVALAVAAASAFALAAFNVAAFVLGLRAPWLLGAVLLADMLVVGVGIFAAARAVLRAEESTERARDALEESEARLAGIVDSAMDAIITVDEQQRILLFNRTAEQLFRRRREEAIGAPLDIFIPERFRAAHRGHIERFGRTGVTSRRMGESPALWALRAGGEEFPIEASISQVAVGGRRYFTVILRDITARKRAQDELQRQLDLNRRYLDTVQTIMVALDAEGRVAMINRKGCETLGYAEHELLGQNWFEACLPQPEGMETAYPVFRRIMAGELQAVEHFENRIRCRDGGLRLIAWHNAELKDAAGKVVGTLSSGEDITERRRTEEEAARMRGELDAARARIAAILDSAMDAIITVDEEQRIVLFNRAAEQMFRVRRDEALGAPLDRFLPQRFREAHREHIERFGRTGVTARRMGDVGALRALRADGEEFPIEASISQVSEGGRSYFTVILRDITLRKRYQDDLQRQQEELRALSAQVFEAREEEKTRIARELHDELGQLLTALKMDLGWLGQRLQGAEAETKVQAMDALLDDTVASVRRIAADLRPLMLDDLGLPEAAGWLAEEFAQRSGVRCDLRLPAEGSLEAADRRAAVAIYRALQESLTNIARHAQARNAWVTIALEDRSIALEVEDDGLGIAPRDLAKVRSLGLKGMRERVHYLGGTVEITRAPRGGTRVRVRIPLQPPAAEGGA
jgi:PAS domain S-box-containing protein